MSSSYNKPKASSSSGSKPLVTKSKKGTTLVRNAAGSSAPRTSSSASHQPGADLASAFGDAGGRIYIKGQNVDQDELSWGGRTKSGSGQKRVGHNHDHGSSGSGSNTPPSHPGFADGSSHTHNGSASHGGAGGGGAYRPGTNLRADISRLLQAQEEQAIAARLAAAANPLDLDIIRQDEGLREEELRKKKEAERAAMPKSREVRRLEKMIADLQEPAPAEAENGDQEEACFCQARLHPLSTYTPSCLYCGLIICSLHLPHIPCPSCGHQLLTATGRTRIINRLRGEVDIVLAKEEQDRERQKEEERLRLLDQSGGGAFPMLSGSSSAVSQASNKANAAHHPTRKIITIGASSSASKGKGGAKIVTSSSMANKLSSTSKAALVSTSSASPTGSSTAPIELPEHLAHRPTRAERKREKVTRVPRPFTLPESADGDAETSASVMNEKARQHEADDRWRKEHDRPWADPRIADQVIYIPPDPQDDAGGADQGGLALEKGKGINGRFVPGAETRQSVQGEPETNSTEGKGKDGASTRSNRKKKTSKPAGEIVTTE